MAGFDLTQLNYAAEFLQVIGFVAIASFAHETGYRHCRSSYWMISWSTTVFIAATIGSMMVPMELMPGLIFDLRHVFLVLAASYCGVAASTLVALAAVLFRLHIGGVGTEAGVAGILISSVVGALFTWSVPQERQTLIKLAGLGVASSLSMASLFLLPWQVAWDVFATISTKLAVINFAGVLIAAGILRSRHSQVSREQQLQTAASVDALTGLANRRAFESRGPEMVSELKRRGRSSAILMIDIDHFKRVNDTFGHTAGDQIISRVAEIITDSVTSSDFVARFGGEEIVLVLSDLDTMSAERAAARIRTNIEAATTIVRGIPIKVTVSIGLAVPGDTEDAFQVAFEAADLALYSAKGSGRNKVILADAA